MNVELGTWMKEELNMLSIRKNVELGNAIIHKHCLVI